MIHAVPMHPTETAGTSCGTEEEVMPERNGAVDAGVNRRADKPAN